MTGQAFAQAMALLEANGPEDQPRKLTVPADPDQLHWDRIDWRAPEGPVRPVGPPVFPRGAGQGGAKGADPQEADLPHRGHTRGRPPRGHAPDTGPHTA